MEFKKIFVLIILFNSLLTISCNEVVKSTKQLDSNIVEFNFPNQVPIMTETKGTIQYKLEQDSINIKDIDKRFILFYVTTEVEISSLDYMKNSKHEVFIDTIGNGRINFKVSFSEKGSNFLNGIIEDKIIFKTPDSTGKIRILSKETTVSKNILVVPKPIVSKNKI